MYDSRIADSFLDQECTIREGKNDSIFIRMIPLAFSWRAANGRRHPRTVGHPYKESEGSIEFGHVATNQSQSAQNGKSRNSVRYLIELITRQSRSIISINVLKQDAMNYLLNECARTGMMIIISKMHLLTTLNSMNVFI